MSRQTVLDKSANDSEDVVVEITRTTRYHVKITTEDLARTERREGAISPNHLVPNNPGALIERLRAEGLFDDVPELSRHIVVLHYVEGMTLSQVAKALGISPMKAKCLKQSALDSARRAAAKLRPKK